MATGTSFSLGDRKLVVFFVGVMLFLTGSFLAVDVVNFFFKLGILYPAAAKLGVSLLASLSVWTLGKKGLAPFDTMMISLAFVFTFLGDICIVTSTHLIESTTIFTLGGISFMVSLAFLIFRHAKGFRFLIENGKLKPGGLLFAAAFFVPLIVIFIVLAEPLNKVGLFWIALFYVLMLASSVWVGWETVRSRLFPPKNAWMIALGLTSFFIMEVIGAIYNIKIGFISDVSFLFTWAFYVPFLILLPLSGYKWED